MNERHYGKLQGLNKSEIEKEYGTKQISLWRRDYLTKPPPMSRNDNQKLLKKRIFKNIPLKIEIRFLLLTARSQNIPALKNGKKQED